MEFLVPGEFVLDTLAVDLIAVEVCFESRIELESDSHSDSVVVGMTDALRLGAGVGGSRSIRL
jgi:hypothetical protein